MNAETRATLLAVAVVTILIVALFAAHATS